eukprot:CAMPEP_0168359180 /NCGR_PEP_ID=MMETSP0228-20121227/1503_1 /TAXON_ID=133427 /ORGANISM="Protoceratium reticulatum, Strain CCCM 535 (=CCMP 1889)" /LENGTH=35 /DNA_ID= /DNA_START= /DNA_END= /DNA_ORIENTATION=
MQATAQAQDDASAQAVTAASWHGLLPRRADHHEPK